MRARAFLAAAVAAALLVSGCAQHQDTGATAPKPAPGYPVTVSVLPGKPVTLRAQPHRIVSLDPTTTENLYAIGAGGQVAAVDALSDQPPSAPRTQLSGLNPNAEAVAKVHPDLVIASNGTGGLFAALGKLNIPALQIGAPKTLDDAYAQITALGKATGHADGAAATVNRMRHDIDATVAATPKPRALTYYHELDQTLYTATSKTFIGSVYARFGLRNIADPADTASAAGYPQLSAEQVIKSDPDLIFLADTHCCGQSAATVAARPGWAGLTAVRSGGVVGLDDAVASRWGPRLVDLVRTIAGAVTAAQRRHGTA